MAAKHFDCVGTLSTQPERSATGAEAYDLFSGLSTRVSRVRRIRPGTSRFGSGGNRRFPAIVSKSHLSPPYKRDNLDAVASNDSRIRVLLAGNEFAIAFDREQARVFAEMRD